MSNLSQLKKHYNAFAISKREKIFGILVTKKVTYSPLSTREIRA
jgi:hypothetical protein